VLLYITLLMNVKSNFVRKLIPEYDNIYLKLQRSTLTLKMFIKTSGQLPILKLQRR